MYAVLRDSSAAHPQPQKPSSPFIVASASTSPTHTTSAPGGANTTATTINMDSADELEENTEKSSSEHSAEPMSTAWQYSHQQRRDHTNNVRGTALEGPQERIKVQNTSSSSSSPSTLQTALSSISAYQSASAALRRLPVRAAPSAAGAGGTATTATNNESPHACTHAANNEVRCEDGKHANRKEASHAETTEVNGIDSTFEAERLRCTPSPQQQQPSVSTSYARRMVGTTTAPGRFQVPPYIASPSPSNIVARSPPAPSRNQYDDAHPSTSSPSSPSRDNTPAGAACSGTSNQSENPGDDVDEIEDEDTTAEEDVAARVLSSLQQKDDMIHQLTEAIASLEKENERLRRMSTTTTTTAQALFDSAALNKTPEAQHMRKGSPTTAEKRTLSRSPSLPATPVSRWWKQQPKTSSPLRGTKTALEVPPWQSGKPNLPQSLATAHAAVDTVLALQEALAEKEAELENVNAQLLRAQTDNAVKESSKSAALSKQPVAALDTDDEGNNSEDASALRVGNNVDGGASASTATALDTAQSRLAQLQYQLDTLQEEKREDQRTMREHVDYLKRELHNKSKEMRRQERQHKLELAGLQREVAALADQLEDQLRAATVVDASSSSHHEVLQRKLAESRLREEKLVRENTAAQQQWLRELEAQKKLVEDAREAARTSEAELLKRTEQERALLQQLTEQQQQVEAQVERWKLSVSLAQKDLAELRAVHQRTEETVAVQRAEVQELTEALASATLQRNHDEQHAAHLEGQVELLHQKLRRMEGELTEREVEVEQLRQEKAEEVDRMLSQHDAQHRTLLKKVEGCMKGSEAVESALLEAEANRREVAAQLTRALAERDDYHRLLRENSVQAQAQLLEQQQLFQEGQEALQQRMQEVQASLSESNGALETAQRELHAVTAELQFVEAAKQAALEEKMVVERQLRKLELSMTQQTNVLVETKEALKEALQAQLDTTNKLRQAERRVRELHEAAQRGEERHTQERHALQRIVKLLSMAEQKQHSAAMTTAVMPTVTQAQHLRHAKLHSCPSQRMHDTLPSAKRGSAAHDVVPTSEEEESRNRGQRWFNECEQRAVRSSSSSSSSVRSASTTTAESVAMSAVNPVDTVSAATINITPASSIHGETEDGDADTFISQRILCEEDKDRRIGDQDASLRSTAEHTIEPANRVSLLGRTTIPTLSRNKKAMLVMPTLSAIHDALQQLLHTHTVVVRELSTKRTAVRTLLKERKVQYTALEKMREELKEHQLASERRKREFTAVMRTEAKTALEDLEKALEKRHALQNAEMLEAERHEHEKRVQRLQETWVSHVGAQLIRFVKQLSGTLHASLSSLSLPAVVERTQEEKEQQQQRALCASQDYTTRSDTVYKNYESQANSSQYASLPHGHHLLSSVNFSYRTAVAPEVQAACDQIARDVLGLAGGWSELSTAAMAEAVAVASPPPPPACADVVQCGEHKAPNASATTERRATTTSAVFHLQEPVLWPAKELIDLQEALDVYLTRFFASLADGTGKTTPTEREEQKEDAEALRTERIDGEGEGEQLSMAMGLSRWMKSLRQPSAAASIPSPPKDMKVQDAQCLAAVSWTSGPATLAFLLNACVAHVVEQVFLGGTVHVLLG